MESSLKTTREQAGPLTFLNANRLCLGTVLLRMVDRAWPKDGWFEQWKFTVPAFSVWWQAKIGWTVGVAGIELVRSRVCEVEGAKDLYEA